MSEKITEHVSEEKALKLQGLWDQYPQRCKGQLDAIAFYYEQGWKDCHQEKEDTYLKELNASAYLRENGQINNE